jgi:hypothetical protein
MEPHGEAKMNRQNWRKIVAGTCLILVFASVGCAKKEEAPARVGAAQREQSSSSDGKKEVSKAATTARKIIVSHNIQVEVGDFIKSFNAVSRMAEQAGGYNTEASRQRTSEGTNFGRIVMRVPPNSAGTLLDSVKRLGEVTKEDEKGEDVTEQYYDLDARLKNAKASEARLLALMGKTTGKMSDVLEIEKELTRVRGDVESMEARKRNMDLDTSMVTIVVELSEPHRAMPVSRKVWQPIRNAFGEGVEVLAQSIRIAVYALFAVIPWLGIAWLAISIRKRFKNRIPAAVSKETRKTDSK